MIEHFRSEAAAISQRTLSFPSLAAIRKRRANGVSSAGDRPAAGGNQEAALSRRTAHGGWLPTSPGDFFFDPSLERILVKICLFLDGQYFRLPSECRLGASTDLPRLRPGLSFASGTECRSVLLLAQADRSFQGTTPRFAYGESRARLVGTLRRPGFPFPPNRPHSSGCPTTLRSRRPSPKCKAMASTSSAGAIADTIMPCCRWPPDWAARAGAALSVRAWAPALPGVRLARHSRPAELERLGRRRQPWAVPRY